MADIQHPDLKTLSEKFRSFISERMSANTRNKHSPGISEEIRPIEELLDNMILETEEMEDDQRRQREELGAREEALVSAGEHRQRNAVTRRQKLGDSGTISTRSTTQKWAREDDEDERK